MSPALDSRLALAASLYEPCDTGADIGTDHGLLPCRLLRDNICRRMVLTDISPKALAHARAQVEKQGLTDRVEFRCADGLEGLTAPVGCLSITGMGGKTVAEMLIRGRDRLGDAVLVLSCHTEQEAARRAVAEIGWHLAREEVCLSGGRYYLLWRAEKGQQALSPRDARLGPLWHEKKNELTIGYAQRRLWVLRRKAQGLKSAGAPAPEDQRLLKDTEEDIAFLTAWLEEGP